MSQNNSDFYAIDAGPVAPATLISIVPFAIEEHKPGLIPGEFKIAASLNNEPSCLVIRETIHYVFIDENRGSFKVRNPSYLTARSIVADYLSSQLAASVDAHPGLFWLPGEWTPERVKREAKDRLEQAIQTQLEWFVTIVQLADDDWEKYRQHFFISDFQRHAARVLDPNNSRQRPWLVTKPTEQQLRVIETQTCGACGSDIPKNVVLCRYCGFVLDPEKHAKMSFIKSSTGVDLSKVLQGAN